MRHWVYAVCACVSFIVLGAPSAMNLTYGDRLTSICNGKTYDDSVIETPVSDK